MSSVLFLAHRIPYPPDRGDKIRSWHLLKHLARHGRVHLACFADDAADAAHLPALREALGGRLGEAYVEVRRTSRPVALLKALASGRPASLTAFDSSSLRSFVERLIGTGDVGPIVAFSSQMAQFVPEGAGAPFVMDFVDMDSAKFAAYAEAQRGPMRWLYRREAETLFAFERKIAARADHSLFVSQAEAELFSEQARVGNVQALSNGIDLDFYDPGAAFRPLDSAPRALLTFTGQMDYAPNVDAVAWFVDQVLPKLPDAHLAIVGRNPARKVQKLAGPRVTVTGGVPDVRPWLAAADVVVAPLRIARGIQNKVLEAMAMARPVVASPAAFEGIEAEPGRDLLVADTAAAMARDIRSLLNKPVEAAALGQRARSLVERSYRWDARLAPLDAVLKVELVREAA